jgi:hypothetical protein
MQVKAAPALGNQMVKAYKLMHLMHDMLASLLLTVVLGALWRCLLQRLKRPSPLLWLTVAASDALLKLHGLLQQQPFDGKRPLAECWCYMTAHCATASKVARESLRPLTASTGYTNCSRSWCLCIDYTGTAGICCTQLTGCRSCRAGSCATHQKLVGPMHVRLLPIHSVAAVLLLWRPERQGR